MIRYDTIRSVNNMRDNTKKENKNNIDPQIITILQKDGRTPFAQIAKKLGVSTGMIRLHYQRMVEKGILQIAAIINPMLMGNPKMAIIGIKADGSRLREIADEVAAFEEVIYLVLLTGSYDLIIELVCKDKNHLLNFLTNKLYKVDGIRDTETFMYLEIIKEDYSYNFNPKEKP